jgi:hypothetical protein
VRPKRAHRRRWRWPWQEIPGDDGAVWSLRMARMACGGLLLFPALFAAGSLAVIATVHRAHTEPFIVGALAVLALAITPVAPFVRERVAQVGIGAHLASDRALRRSRSVYATFATASITAFLIAQVGALFGFVATVLTRQWMPLMVGSVLSYLVWWLLWPRPRLWARWSWQAQLHREDEA